MTRLSIYLFGLICFGWPVCVKADDLIHVQAPPMRQACFADYMRFCRDVMPGGGRIIGCLNARAEDLSQSCFQAMTLRGLASAGALKLCREDYERLCSGTPLGLGRGLACLLNKIDGASPACRDALQRQDLLRDDQDSFENKN